MCEIEFIVRLSARDQIIIGAKRLNDVDFKMSDTSSLGNIPIEKFIDIPRAHDKEGNIRLDLFAFILKNKSDKDKLSIGQTVELLT